MNEETCTAHPFDGADLTGDGEHGLPREADRKIGLIDALNSSIFDACI